MSKQDKTTNESQKNQSTQEPSEIVIALVSAVGCDLGHFTRLIEEELDLYDYSSTKIRVSTDFLHTLETLNGSLTKLQLIDHLMTVGNNYRSICENNGALAYAAIAKIAEKRAE